MGLEAQVMRTLKTIKSGLELLDDRRATAAAVAAAASTAAMDNDGQGSLRRVRRIGCRATGPRLRPSLST